MTLSKKLIMLSAALAFSFGMTACGGDSDDSGDNGNNNGNNENNNNNNNNNNDGDCTPDTFTCQDNMLLKCSADKQWALSKMCGDAVCDKDQGDCIKNVTPICDPENFVSECIDKYKYTTCSDDGLELGTASCGTGKRCNMDTNECEADPCAACESQGKACVNDQCVDNIEKGIIGTQCSCNSNCQIIIKGKELKQAVNLQIPSDYKLIVTLAVATVNALGANVNVDALLAKANEMLNTIGDNDEIKAPNYFSQDITGCDGLVAPDGMAVGCLFTDTIAFPTSINTILDEKLPEFLNSDDFNNVMALVKYFKKDVDIDAATIMEKVKPVSDLLKKGIEFKATNGYCMTADIEITADLSSTMTEIIPGVFSKDGKTGLVSKINTVNLGTNHKKAKKATCPTGSTLLSYTIDENNGGQVDVVGTFRVGFDMCAQQCISSADCRQDEGYKCIRIPNSAPDGQGSEIPKSQVCFNADMIDYFCNMTNMFDDGEGEPSCNMQDYIVD